MIAKKVDEYIKYSERLIQQAEKAGQDVKEWKKALDIVKDWIEYLKKRGLWR